MALQWGGLAVGFFGGNPRCFLLFFAETVGKKTVTHYKLQKPVCRNPTQRFSRSFVETVLWKPQQKTHWVWVSLGFFVETTLAAFSPVHGVVFIRYRTNPGSAWTCGDSW